MDPIWSNIQRNLLNTIGEEQYQEQLTKGADVREEDAISTPVCIPQNQDRSTSLSMPGNSSLSRVSVPLPQFQNEELQIIETQIPEKIEEVVCEGTVHLHIEATQDVSQLMSFVAALRRDSDFRFEKLLGTATGGADVWLELRAPIPLVGTLFQMGGVSHVKAGDQARGNDEENSFVVTLGRGTSSLYPT